MTAQTPYISFKNLSKSWQGKGGVQDFSLDIQKGDFVALVGPSGCGKSTTLRLIAGLEQADSGQILIDGEDITHRPSAERHLSMVFQSYALFPHMNVQENIEFGLKIRKHDKAERQKRIAYALEVTALLGYEKRKPAELSGGQRQRVALARAIVANHPICLMDEPLSNLDAALRHSVRKDIKKLQQDLGLTVIYVTHDQSEAMSMADQIVLIKDGKIEQAGKPSALYHQPATSFVASFIGTPPMALIQAEALTNLNLTDHATPLKFGIRPQDLKLVTHPGASKLSVTVTGSDYLGNETWISFDHPHATGLCLSVPGEQSYAPGTQLFIDFDRRDLHFFHLTNGQRQRNPFAVNCSSPSHRRNAEER